MLTCPGMVTIRALGSAVQSYKTARVVGLKLNPANEARLMKRPRYTCQGMPKQESKSTDKGKAEQDKLQPSVQQSKVLTEEQKDRRESRRWFLATALGGAGLLLSISNTAYQLLSERRA